MTKGLNDILKARVVQQSNDSGTLALDLHMLTIALPKATMVQAHVTELPDRKVITIGLLSEDALFDLSKAIIDKFNV